MGREWRPLCTEQDRHWAEKWPAARKAVSEAETAYSTSQAGPVRHLVISGCAAPEHRDRLSQEQVETLDGAVNSA